MSNAVFFSDSHCHFDSDLFSDNTHWALAQKYAVKRLLIPGVSYEQSQCLVAFCENKPWYFAYGLHPYFLSQHTPHHLDGLCALIQKNKPIAIGECGLDFNLSKKVDDEIQHKNSQIFYFERQIQIAKQFQLPLILHSVKAHHVVLDRLKSNQFDVGGIVHGFSGSLEQAKEYTKLNIKLGIGGLIAKTNNHRLKSIVKSLPASAFMIETDAPDMPPDFSRSRQSSPVFIALYAQIIAHLKNMELSRLCAEMEKQWQQVFKTQ